MKTKTDIHKRIYDFLEKRTDLMEKCIKQIAENKDKSIATVDFGKSMGQKSLLVDWIKANCICFDEF